MSDPQSTVLDLLYERWRNQVLYAGVKLDLFEAIDDSPKAAESIARDRSLDPAMTYRLLRALASMGVLREHDDKRFSITPEGRFLRADHARSLRHVVLLREGPAPAYRPRVHGVSVSLSNPCGAPGLFMIVTLAS